MSSTESKLMWVAIVLSLLLVFALGTIAVFSVLGQEDETGTESADDSAEPTTDETPAPASPSAGATDDGADLGTIDPPAVARCGPADEPGRDYVVVIGNPGDTTTDYVVTVELTVAGSGPLITTTDVPGLAPGERRRITMSATGPGGRRVTDCSVAAIQSDRRVLLANR